MGGGLALALACARPDAVSACAPFYGVMPWPNLEPDWSKLDAAVLGHFAENDSMFTPAMVGELESRLRAEGKEAEFIIHPSTDHAFFNDTRPEVHDPAAVGRGLGLGRAVPQGQHHLSPGMADAAAGSTIVDRYLELGLRLGRHVDGFVDAYYGPAGPGRARRRRAGRWPRRSCRPTPPA